VVAASAEADAPAAAPAAAAPAGKPMDTSDIDAIFELFKR